MERNIRIQAEMMTMWSMPMDMCGMYMSLRMGSV